MFIVGSVKVSSKCFVVEKNEDGSSPEKEANDCGCEEEEECGAKVLRKEKQNLWERRSWRS